MRLALTALAVLLLPQDKPTWPQIVARGEQNLQKQRVLKAAMPREGFDPASLVRSLGGDPAKAAEFVRARIAIEPVRGFVKGAQGTLVSGKAGWADRALLLATLLADKSPVLVKGVLAPEKQPAAAAPVAPVPAATSAADVAAKLQTDPARLEKKVKEAEAAADAFHGRAWTRIRRDLDAVAAALQAAGVKAPETTATAGDEVWWVRIGDKDLERPAGAEEKSVHALADLPVDDLHRLTIRMTIRSGEDEIVVLDASVRTMDVFGRVLTVSTIAGEDAGKLTKLQSAKPKDHLDVLAATGLFVPLLTGAGKPVSGHPFDLTGAKREVANGAIQKLGAALSVFDRLPGGNAPKKELTGAWLDVVRSAPGEEPAATRREILKKGVKGRQRVFDLLSTREILVLPGPLRGDFALDLLLESDIAVKEALLKQIKPGALFVSKRPARLNAKLYEFALARAAALRELKAPTVTGTTLVSFVHRILDGKTLAVRGGFDILANPTMNRSSAADWKGNAAFVAGIIDTALERELHTVKGAHANASVQLEQAKTALKVDQEGGRIRVVIPGRPGAWYEIDPRTGSSLGMMEEGGGQDMAEYATLLADKVEEIREWQSHAELLNSILECAMNAIGAAAAEASFAHCVAGVAIGEAFGWAAGGIIGGAAGDNPFARFGGMALEDAMTGAFGDAMDAAMGGR